MSSFHIHVISLNKKDQTSKERGKKKTIRKVREKKKKGTKAKQLLMDFETVNFNLEFDLGLIFSIQTFAPNKVPHFAKLPDTLMTKRHMLATSYQDGKSHI